MHDDIRLHDVTLEREAGQRTIESKKESKLTMTIHVTVAQFLFLLQRILNRMKKIDNICEAGGRS